ncbi:MAG TPA: hypothetical protein VFG31_05665 [Conexibacter sp.]|nr:hypothetical protein [Conexibacter sp.]
MCSRVPWLLSQLGAAVEDRSDSTLTFIAGVLLTFGGGLILLPFAPQTDEPT